MKLADKLPTVVEGAQKIHDEVVGQSDLIAQIKAKVNSLPEAGGGEKPTLFAPTIALNSVSSELTITDNRNGDFVPWYDLYIGGEKITTLTSKTAMLADYIEHTETMNVYVQSNLKNFNSIESNVVTWEYENVDGTAGLAYGLSSDGTFATCIGIGDAIETDIKIAGKYEGAPVTRIKMQAFKNSSITSVVIPSSITDIEYYTFDGCTRLKGVYISDLEKWCKINFASNRSNPLCNTPNLYLDNELLTELNIPNTITKIGSYAFFGAMCLTSINIPTSVTAFGYQSFTKCGFSNVAIPNSITSIPSYLFYYCSNLKRLDFSTFTEILKLENKDAFDNTHADLQIKVPANLIDQWKTATNWSTYADKIVTEFTN
jgi:hypothetical protein